MAQKFFDLSPSSKLRQRKEIVKKVVFQVKEKKRTSFIPQLPKLPPKLISSFFLFLLLPTVIFLLSTQFSKTEIKIWPRVEEVKLEEKFTIDTNTDKTDPKQKTIRGKLFETEESFSLEYKTTGTVLKKAEGTIRLFNEYKTETEIWRAGTRFVSSEGKLFISKDKIVVPGAKIENGKIKASYVDVPVEAVEGGEEYNIGPSDFSILVFKGDPRYFKYYGKSYEPMKGGGRVPTVTKEDIESAERLLIETAKEKAKTILKNRIPENYFIPDEAIFLEILEKTPSAKEGEEVEKFLYQAKLKIKAIGVSKNDLLEVAKNYLLSNIDSGKEIYYPSLITEQKSEVINFDLGKMTILLKISAKTYFPLDLPSLKKGLAEKPLSEAKQILLNHPHILKSQIRIFPIWAKKISGHIDRIEIFYPLID